MISVITNANTVGLRLANEAVEVGRRVERVVGHHGQLLQTRVKGRASGRPGPNAPTGDYRRSITKRTINKGGEYSVIVGTNKPQGRRLEFGFVGPDSLGRVYDQPPYPHFGPALADTRGPFLVDLRQAVGRVAGL